MDTQISIQDVTARLEAMDFSDPLVPTLDLYVRWLRLMRAERIFEATSTCRKEYPRLFSAADCCNAHRNFSVLEKMRAAEAAILAPRIFPGPDVLSQVWWQQRGIDHPLVCTIVE